MYEITSSAPVGYIGPRHFEIPPYITSIYRILPLYILPLYIRSAFMEHFNSIYKVWIQKAAIMINFLEKLYFIYHLRLVLVIFTTKYMERYLFYRSQHRLINFKIHTDQISIGPGLLNLSIDKSIEISENYPTRDNSFVFEASSWPNIRVFTAALISRS